MEERIFIGVGSNIDPERNIQAAGLLLRSRLPLVKISTFFWTTPVDRPEQAAFLNGVFEVQSELTPRELKFGVLREVEAELGRTRNEDSHAPREIDLDLLLYGSRLIREQDLELPDPDIGVRPFIAVPLSELAPDLRLPNEVRLDALEVVTRRSEMVPDVEFSNGLKVRLLK